MSYRANWQNYIRTNEAYPNDNVLAGKILVILSFPEKQKRDHDVDFRNVFLNSHRHVKLKKNVETLHAGL